MYDPANRNRAEILEDIPLPVDDRGNFCPDRSFFGYFTLVAPYIPLLAVILYIYYTF